MNKRDDDTNSFDLNNSLEQRVRTNSVTERSIFWTLVVWKAATPLKVVGWGPDVRCLIGKGVKSGIYFWWRLAVSQDFVRRRKGCPAGWLISSTVSQEFSHLPKPLITVTTTKVYYFWSSDTFGFKEITTISMKRFPFHSIFSFPNFWGRRSDFQRIFEFNFDNL